MIRSFNEWFEEFERLESVYSNFIRNLKGNADNYKDIKSLIKCAFDAGYKAGELNKEFLVCDLKNEIRTQRLEIAGLREERRGLVDKDYPPGYNWDF